MRFTAFNQLLEVKLSTFQFNKISIIESLSESDRKTGREVFDDLEFLEISNPGRLETEYNQVHNKVEFARVVGNLAEEVDSKGVYPILHIEAHGNDEGLKLGENNYIEWCELLEILSQLNISMKGNLLVVLASCYGACIIRHISTISRAPFWGVIAPYENTYPANVYGGLNKFYNAICSGKNSEDTISALNTDTKNNDLKLFTAELLFVKASELAVSKFLSKESIAQRIEKNTQNLGSADGLFLKTPKQLESEFILLQKSKFEKGLMHFMLVDLHPKNINKISRVHNPWKL